MNFEQYETTFRFKANNAGFSEERINQCLEYSKPLFEKDLPIIFNTENLSSLVGYRTVYLKKAAVFTKSYYRTFSIKKNNGKLRQIAEPLPSLKEIQTWILENILEKTPVSKFAKAYLKNRKIFDSVRWHRGKEKVLTLDVENFFGSIKRREIEKIFSEFGYSSNLSNLLSKLCCLDESLPQGAPTSPYISNIYLKVFDTTISNVCIEKNIRYTRYADDLAFSGSFDEAFIENLVIEELQKINLRLNIKKTNLMRSSSRQIVTGVVVNKVIQVPKEYRNEIRNELFYIKKFGLHSHIKKTNNKRKNYLLHLKGKINHVLSLNPNDKEMIKYKLYLKDIV